MQGYVPAQDGAFAESRKCFGELEDWMASAGAAGLQHGELEEQLEVRGRELLRLMFQDRLDLTAAQEERRHDVTGEDGVVRTRAERGRTRPLVTKFGQVMVSRIAYRSPGGSNVHLLDAALNLPEEKHSHGLRRLAAIEAAAEGKLATRLSPGEKNGRKRMAELACVYDAAPVPRTPEDIISTPAQKRRKNKAQASKPRDTGKPREPQARGKWLTASVTDAIPAVIAAAFGEAERRDPGHSREWAVLVDGNTTQIEAVTAEAAARGVTVTIVIDFIHVLEYLWKAAWSFFGKGEPAAEEWVAGQARKILHGSARQAAAGIRRRATTCGYSPAERAGADECARYLDNKSGYLDYATALGKGWPVATGVIEGACRHIVKDRMDITGARWGLEGAEAILKLRALIASGDFDAYWRYHLRREHEHIHHARYRESLALAA